MMLFKNIELENKYLHDGFVVIPLLNEKELKLIRELYDFTYSAQSFEGLQPLLRTGDAQTNINLHHDIGEIVKPAIDRWFLPYQYNANHFIVKGAGDINSFRLHQDWNVVDETKYIAAHLWIALQDTDKENGALFVLKGSHKYFDNIRSGSCGITFIDNTPIVNAHRTTLSVSAGDAIVYQQALFHGSYPNSSSQPRLVCLSSIRPLAAPMVYYQQSGDDLIEHEISPEILLSQLSDLEKGIAPKHTKSKENNCQPSNKTNYLSTTILEEKLHQIH